jgi:protease I
MSNGKILIVIGDAAEALDTMYPMYRVQEDDYESVVAAPEVKVYPLVMHEIPPGWTITKESPSYHLASTIAFRDVKPEQYAGMFITGGRAPEYLRYDPDLIRITRHFFETRKPVGCVCHGIEIIAAADVIRGRRVATVAKCQYDAEFSGGIYVNEACVRDGNLVSGRTYRDNPFYMREFMKMLAEAKRTTTAAA